MNDWFEWNGTISTDPVSFYGEFLCVTAMDETLYRRPQSSALQ